MWREGIVEVEGRVIRYQAKVYEVGSRFGINGGRVSKLLFLSDGEVLLSYDRGWDVKPTCKAAEKGAGDPAGEILKEIFEMEMTTAYMVAERRLMEAFAAEMEVKAHTNGFSGSYQEDGVFVARFQTEPEPVKGNKAKMEALRAAGYTVEVYAPYNWNRRRAFVVWVSRPVIITDADREIAGYDDYAAFEIRTRNIKGGRVVDGFFVRGQRCSDYNWPLLASCESLEAAKDFIRGIRIDAIRQPVYGPDGYCMNV